MAVGRHISLNVGREPRIYTRTVSDLIVPRDAMSSIKTTPPVGGDPWAFTTTKYGYTAVPRSGENKRAAFDRISPILGMPDNYRWYTPNASLTWAGVNGPSGDGFGNRLRNMAFICVSNKVDPRDVIAGNYDAMYTNFCEDADRPVMIIWPPHEVDVKNPSGGTNATYGTPAHFRDSGRRIQSIIASVGNPLVVGGPSFGYHQFESRWPLFLSGLDDDEFDFVGFDPYRYDYRTTSGTTFAHGYNQLNFVLNWLQNRWGWTNSRRIIIHETAHSSGDPSNIGLPSDTQASNYLNGHFTACEEHELFALQYFYNDNSLLISTAGNQVDGTPTPPYPLARAQWFAHSGYTDPGGY